MANENFLQLPTVTSATLADVIAAVQSNVTVQETLQQVFNLFLASLIQNFAGNPNGNVAGVVYELCWDTTHSTLYICTISGSSVTAVWTAVANPTSTIVTPTFGGTGVSNPTAHTLPVAEGSSNFNFLGPLINGQLLIGSTGVDPSAATLTAGSGIGISNGAGSITISSTGTVTWNDITGTSATMVGNNGYISDNSGLVTLTLPSTIPQGNVIEVSGNGSGGWKIAQNSGQSINFGSSTTTVGAGGSLASINRYDSIKLLCTVSNTTFSVLSVMGNITVV